MTDEILNPPYGGTLVNRVVPQEEQPEIKAFAHCLPEIALNRRQMCDLEMIVTGAFSPLTGFMEEVEYNAVISGMHLPSGLLWPIPVCLDVEEKQISGILRQGHVCLTDPEGFPLAVMQVNDIWTPDKTLEAEAVYGPGNPPPQARHFMFHSGPVYVGGPVSAIAPPQHYTFCRYRRSPSIVRKTFGAQGVNRIISFQTRHPIHRAQFELTRHAMNLADARLLIQGISGQTRNGDFDPYTRVRCYEEICKKYPEPRPLLNLLPLAMRMAGPKEALLHAIIAKNFGVSHILVGHGHADPCTSRGNGLYYPKYAAAEFAVAHAVEIGIDVIPFSEMRYLYFDEKYHLSDTIPEDTQSLSISGETIRHRIRTGKRIPEWATFPEVIDEIRKTYPPPEKQGFTIFMTGLSGAGKSTIARVLLAVFQEMRDRPVILLDGDVVRRNLSSELNFSRAHRDINVQRIGFVACEITKNRGIAICAPIAPYAESRQAIRESIEPHGGFFEVHVATPLHICEDRDRKGMYAKARKGLIKGFTGIDDPYESPVNPEVSLDTSVLSPIDCVQKILNTLKENRFILNHDYCRLSESCGQIMV
jgi:sulfate adenylyltransferase